jgi:hypothetical protein
MKSRLLLYMLLFAILIILFQWTNSRNYVKANDQKVKRLENKIEKLQDSTQQLLFNNLDLQYFDLANNDDALSYYDHLNIQDLPGYISDQLISTNKAGKDNPLVPYAGMEGTMNINKIKILNHKWIIADFSDGKYWGELLFNYEIKEDLSIQFTLTDHLLYTAR